MKSLLLTMMLLLLWSSYSSAQMYSSSVQTKDLTFPLPKLSEIPELHADMSPDCMAGYIGGGSLVGDRGKFFQVGYSPMHVSIQDLRFMSRLAYGIDEYSHAHFSAHFAARSDTGTHGNLPFLANFYMPIMKAIYMDRWKDFEPQHRDLLLTHYIYRVRVVNAVQGIDSSFGSNYAQLRPRTAVSCEVLEIIKGTKVPNSCRVYSSSEKNRHNEKPLDNNPLCLTFCYNARAIKFVPHVGEECYVFLRENTYSGGGEILSIDYPSGIATYGIPSLFGGATGLFCISGGMVDDPQHFWSPNILTVNQFRALLQSKIAEIKSWNPT